jgi:hypothetical protein
MAAVEFYYLQETWGGEDWWREFRDHSTKSVLRGRELFGNNVGKKVK